MRGLALFVAGTLVGLAATSMAQNQGPNRGVVGINHVALAVPDIDKAVEHYTKVMGFPEAFRVRTPQGEVQLVYIQVSKDTFIELQTINAQRPAGIYHFGVVVEDMAQATAMWKARGADVREITLSSGTKAVLSNIRTASAWSCCNCRPTRCTPRRRAAGSNFEKQDQSRARRRGGPDAQPSIGRTDYALQDYDRCVGARGTADECRSAGP
jgi:Glyoxalase/Bleomycin resistance protein/Dioxygenase superfamily